MPELGNSYNYRRQVLMERLREAAPGRIQILTGPRQVGKTTLLLELAAQFGDQAVYAAGDDPSAALPGFWEMCWADAEARAKRGNAVLFLDMIQVPRFPVFGKDAGSTQRAGPARSDRSISG
jgi:predicted AAA+ superfamily ATPase